MKNRFVTFLLSESSVLWFVWITLTGAAFYAVWKTQWMSLFVILLTLFFTMIPMLLQYRWDIKLPRMIVLLGVVFAYASLFLGEIHGFYEYFWWWDLVLHASSAVIFGLVGLGVLRMMQSVETIHASASVVAIFGFTFALAIGALWEIIEFLIDQVLATNMQKSLRDTMSDLIVDALGAFVVTVFGYLHWKYGRTNVIGETIENFILHHQEGWRDKK